MWRIFEIVIQIILVLAMVAVIIWFLGCQQSYIQKTSNDPNTPAEIYKGKAADIIAEAEAKNRMTEQGRVAELEKFNAYVWLGLIVAFVAGSAFWGFTRSRYGWVIPAASVCGMFLVRGFAQYGEYILLGVFVIALLLVVWKAIEYQKERNAK